MDLHLTSRNAARRAIACLALLGAWGLSGARAEAACGDYVLVGGHHVGHGMPASSASSLHAAAAGARTDERAPSGGKTPKCHGPLCSSGKLPPAAPAPHIKAVVERWADLGSMNIAPQLENSNLVAAPRQTCELVVGAGILRPPR